MNINFYAILNTDVDASADKIKEAILREQRIWSGRTNAPSIERKQEAERMVEMLDQAEAILLDPHRRAEYDNNRQTAQVSTTSSIELDESDLVTQGRELLLVGNVADALFVAAKATEQNPDDPEAWALHAHAKFLLGDIADSIYEFKRSIELDEGNPSYRYDLGTVFESIEEYSDALACYEQASKLYPQATAYRAAMARVLAMEGRIDEAIKMLERCLEEDPKNQSYSRELAFAFLDRARQGWTYVEEGHPILPEGFYATDITQIENTRYALEKGRELAKADINLQAQLATIEKDIEFSSKRRFAGNWGIPAIAGVMGMFEMSQPGGAGGFFLFSALLYVFSTFIPVYIINRKNLLGEEFNDFGWIADRFSDHPSNGMKLAGFVIMLLMLPIYAVINLYRYWGDAIKIQIEKIRGGEIELPKIVMPNIEMPFGNSSSTSEKNDKSSEVDYPTEESGPTNQGNEVSLNVKATALLEEHLPKVKQKVNATLKKSGKSIDEYGAEKLFGHVHKILPIPVRLIINKKKFVSYCMKHKEKLV